MARYSQFKYSEQKYGSSTVTGEGALTWIFLVDWDGDGAYDGTNEAAWMMHYSMERGREDYLNAAGSGFEHMDPDTVTLTMYNKDRRYDPRNTSSPLYPNVFMGKKCQIAVMDNSTSPRTRYTRFTGYIDDIKPSTGTQKVTFTCKGNLQTLADQELTSQAAHTNTSIHKAFIDLLHEANYPGGVSIDPDTQPVISFAVDRQKAGEVAGQLADAALGHFFVDVEGVAKFYARDHDYGSALAIDEDIVKRDFIIPQPWENVFNQTAVICHKQIREQPSVIYFLSNPLELDTGGPVDLFPSFESSTDIAIGAAEANSQADGKGTDILTSTSLATFALGPMGGQISFNTSAAGYLTKLEIRGRKWKDVEEIFSHNAAAKYGNRKFTLDTPFLQDRNYANAFMGKLWPFLDDDRESLVIQIINNPAVQFALDLLDKVNFTSADYDIDANYWVMGISEEWLAPTGESITTFYLSKIVLPEAIVITPASIEDEAVTPLGLDNPAGDSDTQEAVSGSGSESGEGTAPLKARACSGSAVMPANLTASLPSGTTSWNLLISHIETDPDDMMAIGSKYITIPEDGDYEVLITGYAYARTTYSGDGDAAGLCPFTTTLSVFGDPSLGTSSAKISSLLSTARLGKASGPEWAGYIQSTWSFADSLTAGQTLYVTASISNAGTSGLSGTLTYRYHYHITVKKIREPKA